MKINISTKNFKTGDRLNEKIERKFEKLEKYFSDDVTANIKLSTEAGKEKAEATIMAGRNIFRAEDANENIVDSIDGVVDKLQSQMSRFKTKLQRKYKDTKEVFFEAIPEPEEEEEEILIAREKEIELAPMSVEEAILQMELLQHNFFVFINAEDDRVSVVYERKNGSYGLLTTR